MEYKIADRLSYILNNDKIVDPQAVCCILEEEIKPIIESYVTLDGAIRVRFKEEGKKKVFFMEFAADRIKNVGYLAK